MTLMPASLFAALSVATVLPIHMRTAGLHIEKFGATLTMARFGTALIKLAEMI
tara:strand:- start:5475 stop:5633 length:159 start_codon:yes stop_codon:yes gene_type:complete